VRGRGRDESAASAYRLRGGYIGRILNGVPTSLLALADEVIG
jgi:hypothetical protein